MTEAAWIYVYISTVLLGLAWLNVWRAERREN